MIQLTINNQTVTVSQGETILDAATKLNIDIPTMCYMDSCGPITSCMVCVVEELNSNRLIPACSMPVKEGMLIETENERVTKARKDTLDLLLSEHVGNCEGPCTRSCPAYMNIPLMIRQIKAEDFNAALRTVKKNIALPAVLGRICPAPCERGCNRKYYDGTVSICLLKRFVADEDLASGSPFQPEIKEKSGKKVAIFGSGPAGLAAAYYLLQDGHDCDVFDDHEQAGGLLRYGIPDEKYDKSVLDAEIDIIRKMGARFRMEKRLGRDISLAESRTDFDAVVLATGHIEKGLTLDEKLEYGPKGIVVNRKTLETSIAGVFAGGNALAEGKMAIRSLGHGKFIAVSVNQLLNNLPVTGYERRFNSVMGKLQEGEGEIFAQQAGNSSVIVPGSGIVGGYTSGEAVHESERCFRCDCRKQVSCKLRQYSDQYNGDQLRFKADIRGKLELNMQHDMVLYEPGKCIKCGLCVKITEKSKEDLGLTFIGRGFNVKVGVPLNHSLKKGLTVVAKECVESCPTAALALQNQFEETDNE
jgi:ribulose 1,5-bisphosphate synthetase/thiazole synthase/ferredoxin